MFKNRNSQNIHCNHCAVKTLCVARDLNPIETDDINNQITKIKVADKGNHIFHAKDLQQNLYAVHTGSCKDYWLDEDGSERINNFYLPGDIIGLESIPNDKHLYSLIALENTELCVIPITALFDLMHQHSNILKRVMNIAGYKMQNDQSIRITTNVNQRIADFILNTYYRLQERSNSKDFISLPMSQLEISNYLGMAHETVNRVLRKFHKEKIITIKVKRIYITDIDRLKELGTTLLSIGQGETHVEKIPEEECQ
ncbi:MAG: helix-turn-helix domain-containing protein [Gammaproteobacteria bacterium]|nr:helix-turn-helix domain-containing protein [Gammaproteobacteria bacterium]